MESRIAGDSVKLRKGFETLGAALAQGTSAESSSRKEIACIRSSSNYALRATLLEPARYLCDSPFPAFIKVPAN